MQVSSDQIARLILADGTIFEGYAFGAQGIVRGEVVFNTGITGYQEVLTDPSYYGQLVTFTFPEIGNTGVNSFDQESSYPYVRGVIIRQLSCVSSNWRSEDDLESWLAKNNIVGISGIDTRSLVRHLREFGSMNGVITTSLNLEPLELLRDLKQSPSMTGLNLADEVSTKSSYSWELSCPVLFDKREKRTKGLPFKVVAVDFGIKKSILHRLVAYGCEIEVVPSNIDFSSLLSKNPEGVFFSNGPGDPSAVTSGISLATELIQNTDLPLFGICLGHQIIGLALGGKTFKLGYGHRGLNHPCGRKGKVEITSQNHGFALDADSLDKSKVEITHLNLNDKTVAGIVLRNKPVFGVQYHPEASPGPHDADHHFGRFVALMADRRPSVV